MNGKKRQAAHSTEDALQLVVQWYDCSHDNILFHTRTHAPPPPPHTHTRTWQCLLCPASHKQHQVERGQAAHEVEE